MKQEDWQLGEDSPVKLSDRIILHQLWLNELKSSFKKLNDKLEDDKDDIDEVVTGFID